MKRILAVTIVCILLVLFAVVGASRYKQTHIRQTRNPQGQTDCSESVIVRDHKICVEVADTDLKRHQGLSGRERQSENHGMLFLFPQPALHTFWMKDMKFPLDFVWIRDFQVVDVTLAVSPPLPGTALDQLKAYRPDEPVDAVLEVQAGTVTALGIATGDAIVRK